MYTAPLADVIRQHGMDFHYYAVDTQVFPPFNPRAVDEQASTKASIEACICGINKWMTANKLLLNGDKTEFLVLNARHRPQPNIDSIQTGHDIIHASKSAKNIRCLVG